MSFLNSIKTSYKQFTAAAVFAFAAFALSGCGGGGGGGGSTTPAPTGSAPIQSAWSPAKNAVVATAAPTVSFSLDENGTCRWSLSDTDYASMSHSCSGTGTRSQSCAVSGLPQGTATFYLACEDTSGNRDTAASNTHISYTVDSAAPAMQFTAPVNGSGPYSPAAPPDTVSVSYSDSGAGINVQTLTVSFTINGRTADISDFFGRDTTANASSSSTSLSTTNPFSRTTLASFTSANLGVAPDSTGTVGRCSSATQQVSSDSSLLYAWDTECSNVWVFGASGGTLNISLSGNAAAVSGSASTGRIYAGTENDAHLYLFNSTSGTQTKSVALPDYPVALSFNPSNNILYIAYAASAEIGRFDCSTETLLSGIAAPAAAILLAAWPTAGGDVIAVGWQAQYKLYRITATGGVAVSASLGSSAPKGLAISQSNNTAFVSRYADGGVRAVDLSTGAVTDISLGASSAPRGIFAAGSQIAVVHSGSSGNTPTLTLIDPAALVTAGGATLSIPAVAGAYFNGKYYLAEDVWKITSQTTVTLNATIQDKAGNTGSATAITFTVAPEVPGG